LGNAKGELLWCQPYAGQKTLIQDQGLGQGPNVVLGLCQQYELRPGSVVSCDNLFTSMDLLDHMAENGWGVTGTMRQNRLVGLPLPSKKDAAKEMKRGSYKSIYDGANCLTVWMDSQPVYIASNVSGVDPAGTCERFSPKEKAYVPIPCPRLVLEDNKGMGGIDLINQTVKKYCVATRLKKWYWPLYSWFLGVQMVQAWRLYRQVWILRHEKIREQEEVEDREFEENNTVVGVARVARRQLREEEKKKLRREEKKVVEIRLLDFIRAAVETIMVKHSDLKKVRVASRELTRLSNTTVQSLRHNHSIPHLIMATKIKGKCPQCGGRTTYRCQSCEVAVHADCFVAYHTAA